ncbi:helix-turn-helix domain-containing protein [Streptomyces sp. 3N207]|uniref:helix-turn-helix domain-containing protein n=1 Tax=Streptomyces sp. 3N207 TaxID=3457417 RepID=UPI003FD2AA5F
MRATKPVRKSAASFFQPEWRQPHQRVAAALTLMVNESNISQRHIAALLRVDPSYVSRMLSGEREASWPHVKAICDACRGDAAIMQQVGRISGRQGGGLLPVLSHMGVRPPS